MRRSALALLLGCLLLVAGASALDGYDYYQTIEYAGCDQDIYQQDIVIHRSTGTAYNETAGGLETWHLYVGEHCREDYGDIRFTNSTGELEYYLWPDYDSSSARFAVRLDPADRGGVLAVHYGNPAATTTSDGGATYFIFDDFNGTSVDTSKWTCDGTYPQIVGDKLRVQPGYGNLVSSCTLGASEVTIEYTVSRIAKAYDEGYQTYGFSTSDSPISVGIQFLDDGQWDRYLRIAGNPIWWQGSTGRGIVSGTARISVSFLSDRVIHRSLSPYTYADEYSASTGMNADHHLRLCTATVAKAGTVDLDDLRVRAYSAAPPAALTFSGEQEAAAPPITAFTATPAAGLAPLTVQFTDASTGGPTSWSWSFGDGGTSTEQNPQHTYTTSGTYTVTLTATNEYGSTPATKLDYITVYGPITAQFTTNITGGTAPLTVTFTDTSTGSPTTWSWTFGDGNTSTAQNPTHTYTTAGAHTITLTASHPYDSDTETKTAYITVAVLQPFPGLTLIPRDLAGNGLYTDINGNGRSDYNDLTTFFLNLAWAKANQPTECFDFNQNGRLDYADVIALFQVIKNA